MWKAATFVKGNWAPTAVISLDGKVFSSNDVLQAARAHSTLRQSPLLHYLEIEATQNDFGRDAIELWSRLAQEEADAFGWASSSTIKALEEALALYPHIEAASTVPVKPVTLAWHDHTGVIIPIKESDGALLIEYVPTIRDITRIERLRHRYATPDHVLETFLDWRGYFGTESLVVDGWRTMRLAGHGYLSSLRGTIGFVVGTVLRRLTKPQLTLADDPTMKSRLIRMSEKYPNVIERCPDLAAIDAVEHDCAMVFVHGTVSCGIQCLKDIYKDFHPKSVYRYEHDTFRSITENACELAKLVRSRIRAKRLLLAAHSRGGLVARLALDDLLQNGYSGDIHVYTFGTPHLGTPLVAMGGKALNLLYRLGEDVVGSLPLMTPLSKGWSYLSDTPVLPRGIEVMGENSDAMELLRWLGNSGRVHSWGSDFDIKTAAPSGFGVFIEGALLGAFGERLHDLVVPTTSALGFGIPKPVLNCSHVHYFAQQQVRTSITEFFQKPLERPGAPDHQIGGILIPGDLGRAWRGMQKRKRGSRGPDSG